MVTNRFIYTFSWIYLILCFVWNGHWRCFYLSGPGTAGLIFTASAHDHYFRSAGFAARIYLEGIPGSNPCRSLHYQKPDPDCTGHCSCCLCRQFWTKGIRFAKTGFFIICPLDKIDLYQQPTWTFCNRGDHIIYLIVNRNWCSTFFSSDILSCIKN